MTDERPGFTLQNGPLPFAVAIDLQGNFHRGLVIGALTGFALGLATCAAAALLVLSLRWTSVVL